MKNIYIDTNGQYVLVPYKIRGTECKCQTWLKNGGVICEWYDIDDIMNNHICYDKITNKHILETEDEIAEAIVDKILAIHEKSNKQKR